MSNNIILTGFMGSGKTTVGQLLAKRLGRRFIDTDALVEEASGLAVAQLFEHGEPYFRALETGAVLQACALNGAVIATGGGAVKLSRNVGAMRGSGMVFYLKFGLEELYEHIKGDSSRPLLNVPNPFEKMGRILAEREPQYQAAAHFVIDCAGKGPDSIAMDIEGVAA